MRRPEAAPIKSAAEWIEYLNSLDLSQEELQALADSAESLEEIRHADPLQFFIPYPKQREFLRLGKDHRERLFMAGNRVGKSQTGAFEVACHATGNYPPDFDGKKFAHPTTGWVCGASGQSVRDVAQLKLFGIKGDMSDTGMIAKDLIIDASPSHGVSGLFDQVHIRHCSGGVSTIAFKSYEQSVEKWMGAEIDWCWVDEEPPQAHYHEALARLTGTGIMFVTFTPLGGLTDLLCRFLREEDQEAARDRAVIQMALDEALHFTEDEKRKRIAGYAVHERDARRYGTPALGSGAVFTSPVEQLMISDLAHVPFHWPKLWAIDFSGSSQTSHPFGAVLLAWDRDVDVVYVLETVRLQGAKVSDHCNAMRRIASDVRVAWPHDGGEQERTSGLTLAQAYRQHGLKMLSTHATWPDGGFSTERGIMELEQRMAEGRFRVRSHLADWFDEYRGYHRKDGKLVKVRDDLMSATRIGIMSLRYAKPAPIGSMGTPFNFTFGQRSQPSIAAGADFDVFA